jgi:hypothetical protein
MPTVQQIRTAIKAKIDTVAGVGPVHEYERFLKDQSRLVALYTSGNPKRVLGWHIRRVSTRETLEDIARWVVLHGWRIRGYMGLDDADASEKLFDDLIEQIRDAFRSDDTLGGVVFSCVNPANDEAGIQVLDHRPVLFCGVLCHFAELGLTTQHLN